MVRVDEIPKLKVATGGVYDVREYSYNYDTTGMTPKEMQEKDIEIYKDSKNRVGGKDGGMKNDGEKPDWSLLPLETIEGIVRVLTYGAKKYERNNWKKVSINRNFAALLRHLSKWQAGEEYDPESGLHHLDHALCDLMFIRWKIKAR